MAETLSLMEFLQALLADAELRGSFGHDPQGTLAAHGLADLTPADVHDALVLVQDNQTVDYSLDPAAAPPPPPPAGDDHEAAVEYLARYLADPHRSAPDEQWSDLDPDPVAAPARFVPDDAPLPTAWPDVDDGYGAGAGSGPGWPADPLPDAGYADLGGSDSYGPDRYSADLEGDLAFYDLDSDDLGDIAGLGDDLEEVDAPDGEGPDDPGSPLPA